jgi:hypothetical protein
MKRTRAIGKEGFLALICSVVMAFQPVFGSPAGAIGTVASGDARLNGSPVPNGAVIYTGDRIATTADGSAAIHLERGAELALGESTAAQVTSSDKGFMVLLEQGRLSAVTGSNAPVVVNSDGLTIAPKQKNGSYEVALNGDALEVVSRRGTTVAEAANRTVEIPEGMMLRARMAQGPPATGQKGQKKKDMVLAALLAAGVTGAGLGIALAEPSKKCSSGSGLTCP